MKKYLFLAVAALGFAACAEKGLDKNGPEQNGELEQSFVAITLAADDMATKAGTDPVGEYEDGTPQERRVLSAHVLFFDEAGQAFPVTRDNKNYLTVLSEDGFSEETNIDNVSDIQKAVLVKCML